MKKGLQIRDKKLENKRKKRNSIKADQLGVCRFIDFKNPEFKKQNGKYVFDGFKTYTGLQVQNRFYYVDETEKEHSLAMTKKGAKVLQIYPEEKTNDFPVCLIQRYHNFLEKNK